jgi:hypothetical protein
MLRKLFHRLRGSLRRGKIESEMERELRFHIVITVIGVKTSPFEGGTNYE